MKEDSAEIHPLWICHKCRKSLSKYVKWGQLAYTACTVRDICTFAILCSVTRPFCRFTRLYEGHFMLCYKEEFKVVLSDRAMANF